MLCATAHTRSAPQLPPQVPTASTSTRRKDQRRLASNISSSLLASKETAMATTQKVEPSSRFAITDLLHDDDVNYQQSRIPRKRAKPGAGPSLQGLVPLSPIQKIGAGDGNTDDGEALGKLGRSQQPPDGGQRQYLRRLDHPENTELFTYASALCHRITGRYMTKEQLQRDPDAQKNEIVRIQRDPELLHVISIIRTLSKEFKEIAHSTLGHRKELGHALLRIEESYLKLFEKLMELSLRMYWRYEQDADAERRADKATIQYWQEMHNWKAGEATKLQKLLESKDILVRTQQIELTDLERQCVELRREVADQRLMERRIFELQAAERELRDRERVLQSDYDKLRTKHEVMLLYERRQLEEAHEQHKRIMEDMKHSLRDKEKQLIRHEKAIRELTVLTVPIQTSTAFTQTEVDDDGLWDTRDGVPRFVSKNLHHRMAWRRFHAYAACKNCRGRPMQQNRIVAARDPASTETDGDYVDVWSLTRGERKSKKAMKRIEAVEAEWRLPDAITLFLSNLPKTVVAFPFYTLGHIIQQIELIYDDKFASDMDDEADGVAREALPSFICEYFLKTHGLRQSAEIGLYRFLVSVKNTYHNHSHVHLFARFCCLLPSDGAGSRINEAAAGAGALMETLVQKPRRGELDRSFLRVFLHARQFLLRCPPPKINKKGVVLPQPQPHVVVVDSLRQWVPLDHAVAITRWYLKFLAEDDAISYCREVEYSTAIYAGKAISEISGNRLAVRAEMRKVMLVNGPDGDLNDTYLGVIERQHKPRIVADVHRVLLLLMHALEQRRAIMEKSLITMFEAGDVNHDSVLSLDEFKAIIRGRVTSFSERRLLRMFREALMGGTDQSFALSMDAFVKVCDDHGLVTLLPDDRWQDPFGKAVETLSLNALSTSRKTINALGKNKVSAETRLAQQTSQAHRNEEMSSGKIADIPEDLPFVDAAVATQSPRAEEVEDDDKLWEW